MIRREWRTWLDTLMAAPIDFPWRFCQPLMLSWRVWGVVMNDGRAESYLELSNGEVMVEVMH
jgi:hypothetical protein